MVETPETTTEEGSAEETTEATSEKDAEEITVEAMAAAGLHMGHRASRVHPRMKPFVHGVRNTVHLIDLEQTKEKLEAALAFIEKIISERKALLIVGTKIHVRDLVRDMAQECGVLYITERWLGGMFTNFETIKKRIVHFKDLEHNKEIGAFAKYTKKERAHIDKELAQLEAKFGGIKTMERLPDAMFVLDMHKDTLAIKEARSKGIPVVALADTNSDPTLVNYPIPANDDAISSVKYILEQVKKVILKAQSAQPPQQEDKPKTP